MVTRPNWAFCQRSSAISLSESNFLTGGGVIVFYIILFFETPLASILCNSSVFGPSARSIVRGIVTYVVCRPQQWKDNRLVSVVNIMIEGKTRVSVHEYFVLNKLPLEWKTKWYYRSSLLSKLSLQRNTRCKEWLHHPRKQRYTIDVRCNANA